MIPFLKLIVKKIIRQKFLTFSVVLSSNQNEMSFKYHEINISHRKRNPQGLSHCWRLSRPHKLFIASYSEFNLREESARPRRETRASPLEQARRDDRIGHVVPAFPEARCVSHDDLCPKALAKHGQIARSSCYVFLACPRVHHCSQVCLRLCTRNGGICKNYYRNALELLLSF